MVLEATCSEERSIHQGAVAGVHLDARLVLARTGIPGLAKQSAVRHAPRGRELLVSLDTRLAVLLLVAARGHAAPTTLVALNWLSIVSL